MAPRTTHQLGLVDFLETRVLPALFSRLDAAFPEFGWTRTGHGWMATSREHTKALVGARPSRVVCHQPYGFYVYGGQPTAWTAYVNGGETPRGKGFLDAVRKLAVLAGIDSSPIDRDYSPEEQLRADEAQRREGLLETFMAQSQADLLDGHKAAERARAYLKQRGLAGEDLEGARLGLFTTTAKSAEDLLRAGFTHEEIAASGLTVDQRWEGRVVGAWRDRWGRIRTLYARDVAGAADEGAKYLYLRGTSKSDLTVFGLDVALRSREALSNLVLVEGLFDALMLQLWGSTGVAAIGGSGHELSATRWEALTELSIESITLVLDNDAAGHEGTLAAIENALSTSSPPSVYVVDPVLLGSAKDPDEFVRTKGLTAWQEIMEQRVPACLHYARHILGHTTPESPSHERRKTVDRVLQFVSSLRGHTVQLEREEILRLAAQTTGYSVEALQDLSRTHAGVLVAQTLQAALRRAELDLSGAQPAQVQSVTERLRGELTGLLHNVQDEPSPFSVCRLERESKALPEGKPSGWRVLDELDVRFNPGELALLAARTGHAKTSTLVGILVNWLRAADEGRDELLLLYSAEEPELSIYHRLMSTLTLEAGYGLTVYQVRDTLRGQGRDVMSGRAQVDALRAAQERARSWERRLMVVARPAWTIEEIAVHAHGVAGRQPVGGVLVDYLQRIPPPRRHFERRDIEVSAVARGMKALAVDLAAPVVAGAQINRDALAGAPRIPEGRPYDDPEVQRSIRTRRPKLHHLREGGSEQEADLVLGLLNYRADFEEDHEEQRKLANESVPEITRLDIGVLKNRYGAPGQWAALSFHGRFGFIYDPGVG